MSNSLSQTTSDFLSGIKSNLYEPTEGEKKRIYNEYSYGYLKKSSDGYDIENDKNPAVESLADFPIPDGAELSLDSDGKGPYIGTVKGQYFALTDCSGYVIYLIAQSSQAAYDEIFQNAPDGNSHSQPWPSAGQYANYAGGNTWTQVLGEDKKTDLSLIEDGDIIAWDAAAGADDTGHVMVAIGNAEASETEGDDKVYTVKISDSTQFNHKDPECNGINGTGVGTGFIGLKVDSDGKLYSKFNPDKGDWKQHDHINILRLKSSHHTTKNK